MATQKSTSFGKLKRPAGREFRSGTLGEAIDDLYADIDDAFETIEKSSGYPPVKWASASAINAVTVTKPADSTVLTNAGAQARLALDGQNTSDGDRVLIKNVAGGAEKYRGIYTVTTQGTGATNWVLTRVADMNETADMVLDRAVLVTAGDTLAGTSWRLSTWDSTTDVLDTDTNAWTQLSGAAMDINGLPAAAIAVADSIAFEDADNATKKATMTQLGAAMAGAGLTNTGGQLSVTGYTAPASGVPASLKFFEDGDFTTHGVTLKAPDGNLADTINTLPDAAGQLLTEEKLALTTETNGAALVGIWDDGANFTATTAEDALAEIASAFRVVTGTIVGEAAEVGVVNIQVKMLGGVNYEGIVALHCQLFDNNMLESLIGANTMAETGDGTEISTTAKAGLLVKTDANGVCQISVTDISGSSNTRWLRVTPVTYTDGVADVALEMGVPAIFKMTWAA